MSNAEETMVAIWQSNMAWWKKAHILWMFADNGVSDFHGHYDDLNLLADMADDLEVRGE